MFKSGVFIRTQIKKSRIAFKSKIQRISVFIFLEIGLKIYEPVMSSIKNNALKSSITKRHVVIDTTPVLYLWLEVGQKYLIFCYARIGLNRRWLKHRDHAGYNTNQ